ncbi:MAG: cellulose synthase operon protein YhjQ/BcsQ [Paraperlucidibaca sp.]
MRVVPLFSRKGGVGRTVFATNLAAIFSEQGINVAVLELDPQNTLSQHFDDLTAHPIGWAHSLLSDDQAAPSLDDVHWSPRENLRIFPFGAISGEQRRLIEHYLVEQPDWLAGALSSPAFSGIDVLLIDTPGGYSVFSDQAERVATSALSIWLCDAASQKAFVGSEQRVLSNGCVHRHIINQINASKGSRRQLMKSWSELLGDRLLPLPIHQDELVSDALLGGTTVTWFAGYSQAAHDFQGLAKWMREAWFSHV